MSRWGWVWLVALAGCARLDAIPAGECGNGVIEGPEESCDGFAPGTGMACRPKGTVGECQLDCRPRADGTRSACPAAWGCNLDGICRPPTARFAAPRVFKLGGASSLLSGDFDGDGRADLLSRGEVDEIGRGKPRFHYFDERGALAETRVFPKLVLAPVVADLSGDGRSDVIFSDPSLGLLLGRSDRALLPETFGSYRFDSHIRLLSVYDLEIGLDELTRVAAIVVFASYGPERTPGAYVLDGQAGGLRLVRRLAGPIEALAGDPIDAQVIEDPAASPCRESILAVRGASSISMLDLCARVPMRGVVLREQAVEHVIALEPPAPIERAPIPVDLDGDRHLDLLIGAGGVVYAAMGTGQGLGPARPYQLVAANRDEPRPRSPERELPLAAGDFSGDGAPDFVYPDHLLLSLRAPGVPLPIYGVDHPNFGALWTDARVVDLNRNGHPDVIASSNRRLDVDFFDGNGTPYLSSFVVPTTGDVRFIHVDDIDGDQINDFALIEGAAVPDDPDALSIAFGTPAGPPLAPAPIGRVRDVVQLNGFRSGLRGNLQLASTVATAGQPIASTVTILPSSGDRLPHAPLALTSFSRDGGLQEWLAFALAVGRFRAGEPREVIALVSTGRWEHFEFWLVPALASGAGEIVPLGGGAIEPLLRPGVMSGIDYRVWPTATAADLDGDGLDEAIWAIPAADGRRCGLVQAARKEETSMTPRKTIYVEAPCARAQLEATDVDADGRPELLLLTRGGEGEPRRLLLFWNDGKGELAPAPIQINPPGEAPEAFALLPALTGLRPRAFVYVTAQAVVLVPMTGEGGRQPGAPETLASVQQGTGVAAADVDGDGALDLALAVGGNLAVMKAELSP